MKIRIALVAVVLLAGACSDDADVEEPAAAAESTPAQIAPLAPITTASVDEKISERLIELLRRRNLHGRHAVSRFQ